MYVRPLKNFDVLRFRLPLISQKIHGKNLTTSFPLFARVGGFQSSHSIPQQQFFFQKWVRRNRRTTAAAAQDLVGRTSLDASPSHLHRPLIMLDASTFSLMMTSKTIEAAVALERQETEQVVVVVVAAAAAARGGDAMGTIVASCLLLCSAIYRMTV